MESHGNREDRQRLLKGGGQTDAAAASTDLAPADETDTHAEALRSLGQAGVMGVRTADVGTHRERMRQGKLRRLALILTPFALWFVVRATVLHRGPFGFPHIPSGLTPYLPGFLLIIILCAVMVLPLLGAGRSPHILYRPNEIDVRFDDVRGAARRRRRGREDPQPLPRPQDVRRSHGGIGPTSDPVRGAAGNRQDLHGQGHGRRGRRALPLRVLLGVPVDVLRPDQPQDPVLLQGAAQVRPAGGRRHRLHRGDRRHRRRPGRDGQRQPRARASPGSSTSC